MRASTTPGRSVAARPHSPSTGRKRCCRRHAVLGGSPLGSPRRSGESFCADGGRRCDTRATELRAAAFLPPSWECGPKVDAPDIARRRAGSSALVRSVSRVRASDNSATTARRLRRARRASARLAKRRCTADGRRYLGRVLCSESCAYSMTHAAAGSVRDVARSRIGHGRNAWLEIGKRWVLWRWFGWWPGVGLRWGWSAFSRVGLGRRQGCR